MSGSRRTAHRVRPRLIIMVKEPVMGRVKTRLGREAGLVTATALLRTNLRVTLARLARDPRWQTTLAVAPDSAANTAMFPREVARTGQGGGDLGARMARVARNAPMGPVVIVGADIPAITPREISGAFAALGSADAVFGPAGDGGYWLVGLAAKARRWPVFERVRWSGPHALADTVCNLAGRRVSFIGSKGDIDDADDLARLGRLARRVVLPPSERGEPEAPGLRFVEGLLGERDGVVGTQRADR